MAGAIDGGCDAAGGRAGDDGGELVAALDGGVEMTQEERLARTKMLIELASTLGGEAQRGGLTGTMGSIISGMQSAALAASIMDAQVTAQETTQEQTQERYVQLMIGMQTARANGIPLSEFLYHYLGGHGVGSTGGSGAGQSGSVERWILWGEEGEGLTEYMRSGEGRAAVEALQAKMGGDFDEALVELEGLLWTDHYDELRDMVDGQNRLSADEADKILKAIVDDYEI